MDLQRNTVKQHNPPTAPPNRHAFPRPWPGALAAGLLLVRRRALLAVLRVGLLGAAPAAAGPDGPSAAASPGRSEQPGR